MWLIAKYIKYIVIFTVLWFSLITYRKFSCHKNHHDMMQPALKHEEFEFVLAGERNMEQLKAGDIVVYQYLISGKQESPYFCGRIIAEEGDRVSIDAGKVRVNNSDQNESYVPADAFVGTERFEEFMIPRGHYFILGDNRRNARSKDSRAFGPIPVEAVVGKVTDLF